MQLTQDDVIGILKLVDQVPSGRFSLQVGDLKVEFAKGVPAAAMAGPSAPAFAPPAAPAIAPQQAAPAAVPEAGGAAPRSAAEAGLDAIKAPVLGLFYRRPEPTAPPFVEEGSLVDEDTTVALIEVMKLFNPVKAGIKGRIRRICVQNAELVQYGQELFLVEPS